MEVKRLDPPAECPYCCGSSFEFVARSIFEMKDIINNQMVNYVTERYNCNTCGNKVEVDNNPRYKNTDAKRDIWKKLDGCLTELFHPEKQS